MLALKITYTLIIVIFSILGWYVGYRTECEDKLFAAFLCSFFGFVFGAFANVAIHVIWS